MLTPNVEQESEEGNTSDVINPKAERGERERREENGKEQRERGRGRGGTNENQIKLF